MTKTPSQNSYHSPVYIGIDVSKETLDICINDKNFKIKNEQLSIVKFIQQNVLSPETVLCVFEATGGYERILAKELLQNNIAYHIAHSNRVHAFGKACGHFAKTDKLDAILLTKYAQFLHERGHFRKEAPMDKDLEDIISLRRLARAAEENLHGVQCRLKQYSSVCTKLLKAEEKFYLKQIAKIEKQIQALVASSKKLSEKSELLQSLKGVGLKSAVNLLAEIPELGSLSKEEVGSLVGVVPKTYESGKKVRNSHIKGGRFYARKIAYMCALVASQHCPILSKKYQELLSRGKPSKVALVALMRKMLIWMNAILRDSTPFHA